MGSRHRRSTPCRCRRDERSKRGRCKTGAQAVPCRFLQMKRAAVTAAQVEGSETLDARADDGPRPNQKPARRVPAGAVRRIAFRQVSVSAKRVKRALSVAKLARTGRVLHPCPLVTRSQRRIVSVLTRTASAPPPEITSMQVFEQASRPAASDGP